MALIAVINGPNLNLLGTREPHLYGGTSWQEAAEMLKARAGELGHDLETFQSNHEGAVIDYIQGLAGRARGMIINPGALTHYSYSLRDALAAAAMPAIEVHITNIHAREEWRSLSVISPVAAGVVSGLGITGYRLALEALAEMLCGGG